MKTKKLKKEITEKASKKQCKNDNGLQDVHFGKCLFSFCVCICVKDEMKMLLRKKKPSKILTILSTR